MTYTAIKKGRSYSMVPALFTAKRFGTKVLCVFNGPNGPYSIISFKGR